MTLESILRSDNVIGDINTNIDYILEIIPELRSMVQDNELWNYTLYTMALSPDDLKIRMTLLLHDLGKLYSYSEKGVKNHAVISCAMANDILTRLLYRDDFIDDVCYLIKYHDTPITDVDILKNKSLQVDRYIIQKCMVSANDLNKNFERDDYFVRTRTLFNK